MGSFQGSWVLKEGTSGQRAGATSQSRGSSPRWAAWFLLPQGQFSPAPEPSPRCAHQDPGSGATGAVLTGRGGTQPGGEAAQFWGTAHPNLHPDPAQAPQEGAASLGTFGLRPSGSGAVLKSVPGGLVPPTPAACL